MVNNLTKTTLISILCIILTLSFIIITATATEPDTNIVGTVTVLPIEITCTKTFEYTPWGSYYNFLFKKDKHYFSGYATGSNITPNINTFANGQVHEILIDEYRTMTVNAGRSYNLEDDYSLEVKTISSNTNVILLSLKIHNREVYTSSALIGDTFIYRTRVGTIDNLPIIAVHIKDIVQNRNSRAVVLEGIFQISTKVIHVDPLNISHCGSHSNKHKWTHPWNWWNDDEDIEDD
jgi:hypothetical protein